MDRWLLILLLLLSTAASAQFNGCRPGFCNTIAGGSPPASNFLLANTGSALLVDVGSKFLVQ